MTPSVPAIETRALTKAYGRHPALSDVELRIEEGSIFGLIGPNGAGKTTTMRLLLDIIRPTSGEISVLGMNPRAGGARLRNAIGYLPGELRLNTRANTREFLRHLQRISGPVEPGTVERLAERLNLDLGRPVRSLSKGNKQKVGLIQAFMHQPRLLILDEPTSGLDPLVQQEFLSMVREAQQNGQTVFLSSHVLREIEQAANHVGILRAGVMVAVSTVEALRRRARQHLRIGVLTSEQEALHSTLARVPGLSVENTTPDPVRHDIVQVDARLDGAVDDLVRALAQHSIADLVIDQPDLEESVLGYYTGEEIGS